MNSKLCTVFFSLFLLVLASCGSKGIDESRKALSSLQAVHNALNDGRSFVDCQVVMATAQNDATTAAALSDDRTSKGLMNTVEKLQIAIGKLSDLENARKDLQSAEKRLDSELELGKMETEYALKTAAERGRLGMPSLKRKHDNFDEFFEKKKNAQKSVDLSTNAFQSAVNLAGAELQLLSKNLNY